MPCWCTKAKQPAATTGHSSTTSPVPCGSSSTTSPCPSPPGKSWRGRASGGTTTPAPTASCTSTGPGYRTAQVRAVLVAGLFLCAYVSCFPSSLLQSVLQWPKFVILRERRTKVKHLGSGWWGVVMNRMHLQNCSHQLTVVWQNVDYRTRFNWSVCQRGQRRPLQHRTVWTPSKLCPTTSRKPLPWTTRYLHRRLRTGTTSKPGNPWAIQKSPSPTNTGLVRLFVCFFWSMMPWADQIQRVSRRSAVRARVHPEVTLCDGRVLKFQEVASCARGPCRSVQFSSGQCCWYLSCVADRMLKSNC